MAQRWGQDLRRRWALPIVVLLVALAHMLRLAALVDLGQSHPFLTFYPAVILAALISGGRAGLAATLLSALVVDYFWLAPAHAFRMVEPGDALSMVGFLFCGLLISALATRLGSFQERLRLNEAAEREALKAKVAAISADLTRNQRRFTAALLNSRVTVWEQDSRLRYTWMWNPKLGYELGEVLGKTDAELMDPACLGPLEAFKHAVLATGRGERREVAVAAPGAPLEWFEIYAEPIRDDAGGVIGLTCVAVEISERVAMERQLRGLTASLERRVEAEVAAREGAQQRAAQAERMQALGRLAGGIAHDLNNVLQAIDGGAALIQKRAGSAAEVRALAARVIDAVDRGAATTRRLLTFSRGGDLTAQPVEVVALLEDVADILRDTLGANIRIDLQASRDLPPVLADKAQLETVLLNLATNARDAMPNGGVLRLSADAGAAHGETGNGETGNGETGNGQTGDNMVRLGVSDTGVGMDEATLARATEPLFTTKPAGRGTGLGLSMARAFAEQSGGSLRLDSAPGEGTTVSLWLPRGTGSAAAATPAGSNGAAMAGRVVLVDDEAFVRETLAAALREAGFVVDEAGDADEALALIADNQGEPIDLLVSDLSMPGEIDGLSLIRSAWGYAPGLPAILLTGHLGAEAEASLDLAMRVGISLVRKPTSGRYLAEQVGLLIAARAAADTAPRS